MYQNTSMDVYYAETGAGCFIREARTLEMARAIILTEVGLFNGIRVLRKATEADIDWVFGKGGQVPEKLLARRRVEKAYADSQAICSPAMIKRKAILRPRRSAKRTDVVYP